MKGGKILAVVVITFGLLCIVIGIIVAWKAVAHFMAMHRNGIYFTASSTAADLGTVLSGTAGVLFTIAGVLFFTFSLYQTTAEMRQTQSILSSQLFESTFFNLMKHHRELVSSFRENESDELENTLESHVLNIQSKLNIYHQDILRKTFEKFSITEYAPDYMFSVSYAGPKLVQSMLHICNLVYDKLRNEEFYHSSFYLTLSDPEKFLLGMAIENEFGGYVKNKRKYNYDYSEYYKLQTSYHSREQSGYFPRVAIRPPLDTFHFYLQDLTVDAVKDMEEDIRKVTSMELESKHHINLNGIQVDIKTLDHNSDKWVRQGNRTIPVINGKSDLFDVVLFLMEFYKPRVATDLDFDFFVQFYESEYVIQCARVRFITKRVDSGFSESQEEGYKKVLKKYGGAQAYRVAFIQT